jgi:hypothetical protein
LFAGNIKANAVGRVVQIATGASGRNAVKDAILLVASVAVQKSAI